jgi:hypothetical protein
LEAVFNRESSLYGSNSNSQCASFIDVGAMPDVFYPNASYYLEKAILIADLVQNANVALPGPESSSKDKLGYSMQF